MSVWAEPILDAIFSDMVIPSEALAIASEAEIQASVASIVPEIAGSAGLTVGGLVVGAVAGAVAVNYVSQYIANRIFPVENTTWANPDTGLLVLYYPDVTFEQPEIVTGKLSLPDQVIAGQVKGMTDVSSSPIPDIGNDLGQRFADKFNTVFGNHPDPSLKGVNIPSITNITGAVNNNIENYFTNTDSNVDEFSKANSPASPQEIVYDDSNSGYGTTSVSPGAINLLGGLSSFTPGINATGNIINSSMKNQTNLCVPTLNSFGNMFSSLAELLYNYFTNPINKVLLALARIESRFVSSDEIAEKISSSVDGVTDYNAVYVAIDGNNNISEATRDKVSDFNLANDIVVGWDG